MSLPLLELISSGVGDRQTVITAGVKCKPAQAAAIARSQWGLHVLVSIMSNVVKVAW